MGDKTTILKNKLDTVDDIIEKLSINISVNASYRNIISKAGSIVFVSNHQLGSLDYVVLSKVLGNVRTDIKYIGNQKELERLNIDTNKILDYNQTSNNNFSIVKEHLKDGIPICIFPSNQNKIYSFPKNSVNDKVWDEKLIKFIKETENSIVPIYVKATYLTNNIINIIKPTLVKFSTKDNLYRNKNKSITIKIGSQINVKEQNEFEDIDQFGRFLRSKIFLMNEKIDIKPFFKKREIKKQKISSHQSLESIENDIKNIDEKYKLFSKNNYDIFCVPTTKIPVIIKELGVLREETFRQVGEGTNKKIDLDEFDIYYSQLFIWDNLNKKIVGAYRIGQGDKVLSTFGINGLYINQLFKISPKAKLLLNQSVELGRSFIVKEYQKNPVSLFLLWQGILVYLIKNPNYRYLIGPVSISNDYSKISKSIIISFIKKHYFDKEQASLFTPRNKFKIKKEQIINNVLSDSSKLNIVDKIISDIETNNLKVPVMLKKYIKLNANIIGFNRDPDFNNALDGLMLLDLKNVPNDTLKKLSQELKIENINPFFNK